MILIDTNALLLLLVGSMNTSIIAKHKRLSAYDAQDYYALIQRIGTLKELLVLPNVWTETDNLLNNFTGQRKDSYISILSQSLNITLEKYIPSRQAFETPWFYDLGLTDSLLLKEAENCELLITGDSALADYAVAYGINVYDTVREKNERLQ